MPVPDFQAFMLPVPRELADGKAHLYKDVRERVAATLHLSPADLTERIPSGKKTRVDDRASSAHVYLKQAGLLQSVRRGIYQITARGQQVLASPPEKINVEFLERFPEYLEFKSRRRSMDGEAPAAVTPRAVDQSAETALTPDEQIRAGYELLSASLAEHYWSESARPTPPFLSNSWSMSWWPWAMAAVKRTRHASWDSLTTAALTASSRKTAWVSKAFLRAGEALGRHHGWPPGDSAVCGSSSGTSCSKRGIHYNLKLFERGDRVREGTADHYRSHCRRAAGRPYDRIRRGRERRSNHQAQAVGRGLLWLGIDHKDLACP